MLKLRDDLLLNESQIVEAKFLAQGNDKTLTLTLTAPVSFGRQVEGNPNQVMLNGAEAENLWRVLSKGAQKIEPTPASNVLGAVVGRRSELDSL